MDIPKYARQPFQNTEPDLPTLANSDFYDAIVPFIVSMTYSPMDDFNEIEIKLPSTFQVDVASVREFFDDVRLYDSPCIHFVGKLKSYAVFHYLCAKMGSQQFTFKPRF